MPAILAATALLGMLGFICCGFSTWYLFEQRTALAIRTLRGSFMPQIEQSLLNPTAKADLLAEIDALASDMEGGRYENWQSSGILQRLQRLPVLQWGELQAIEAVVDSEFDDMKPESDVQLSRLRYGVETSAITSFEFEEVLAPARINDNSELGHRINPELGREHIAEVIRRADLAADRAEVPEQTFENPKLAAIVKREIELGSTEGGF